MATNDMKTLLNTMPQEGRLEWIGLRPDKRAPLRPVTEARLSPETGLQGDHYQGRSGKRQVTLIQAEHIEAVAQMLGRESLDPGLMRRNLVVSGLNVLALKDRQFALGDAVLEATGLCHPCSRMEENLGAGGYNAMRGHGGITARVIEGGTIALGDRVRLLSRAEGPSNQKHDG